MKKTILALMILVLTTTAATAQSTSRGTQRGNNKNCPAYVDNNKDGVCDNAGTINCTNNKGQGLRQGGMCAGRRQNNANGLRNGSGNRQGINFVDANKNGVCDTYEKSAKKQ